MTTTVADNAPIPSVTDLRCQVVVLGAGPGGYTAAFRAADLGLDTILIERYPTLGGVCLNVGCIPSKALLHAAEVIDSAQAMVTHGIDFGPPHINRQQLRDWKDSVVTQLAQGLDGLARQRKLRVVHGTGRFTSAHTLQVQTATDQPTITFDQAIIAAGSQPIALPAFPNHDRRLLDSTAALQLNTIPERMLVIGGGIIGLEMASIYNALGAEITLVELTGDLLLGCDRDLVMPLQQRIQRQYQNIFVHTRVTSIAPSERGLVVALDGDDAPDEDCFDSVLVAVGRTPNGHSIAADTAGVAVNAAGFITTDPQQRTNVSHIFAIGDIVGAPMLAHKATHQGKIAAEVIAGHNSRFEALTIPSVAYTNPEVAWAGVTETEATVQGSAFDKAMFPWAANGRALGSGCSEGLTKLLFDTSSGRLIGAGIVGPHAGELISEAVLAIEMGADAIDIGLTIHPHPTLSETLSLAAEMVNGTITDLYIPRKR